jgi:hypothetical protein
MRHGKRRCWNVECRTLVPRFRRRVPAALSTNIGIAHDWTYCPLGPQRIDLHDGFLDGSIGGVFDPLARASTIQAPT